MTIATRLYTWLRGVAVGHDAFGNTYYRDKTGATRYAGKRQKRWVLYAGEAEATKVPPEWHRSEEHTSELQSH